ncbi:hypothetical protein [Luteolibacter sp. LG18]|uniref:hypothetical protein n=1 Tax=Luteolibacter sp. LG18 TaxID=2819286 RepID=UPI002B28C55B|nr:hypothetical protein llg_05600 [Luteolibacter sp. LG18]
MNPPPLPPAENPYATWHKKPAGMATGDGRARVVVTEVMNGARFRTLPWVASMVVVTLHRDLGEPRKFAPGEWPTADLLKTTLTTALLGWWGLPFGPIYTLLALFYLWQGGRDRTTEVLAGWIGEAEAKKVLLEAKAPVTPPVLWVCRGIILLPLIGFLALAMAMYQSLASGR